MTEEELNALVKQAMDRAIERLQKLHDYAGRPAWDQVICEELSGPITTLRAQLAEARATLRYCETQWQDTDKITQTKMLEERARADRAEAEARSLKAAIFGSENYALDLKCGNFVEMAQTLHAAQKGGLDRADRAEAALAAQIEKRKTFPVLGQRGASVDFQLVADHAEQANRNHYQTVDRLAERGGLSWCELFAVLHNQPWKKVDTNEAMIACRALEARYLAAVTHDQMLTEAREKALREAAQVLTDEIDLSRIAMPQAVPILAADRKAILALIEKQG